MACGARSGLKLEHSELKLSDSQWLNGLWSPFGFETVVKSIAVTHSPFGLNGLWSPFGFETCATYATPCFGLRLNGLWSPFGCVRHVTHHRIPGTARRNEEKGSWVIHSTLSRKARGKAA